MIKHSGIIKVILILKRNVKSKNRFESYSGEKISSDIKKLDINRKEHEK